MSLFALFLTPALAQNKSLGVGTATPNANAALHVESPTGNQGFIMPRLTTAQRTTLGSVLTATDNGLMLYDTDLNTIYIWDGSSWRSTAEVAGGAKLSYPYVDSVVTPTGTNDLFALKYNNEETKRVLRIENINKANLGSAVSISNTGSGLGAFISNNNDTTSASALYATTNSNYDGGGLSPVAVYGESTGTGALASSFRITNTDNPLPAVWAETTGSGATFQGHQIGTGDGIVAEIVNDTSSATAIRASTIGTGPVAHFVKTGTAGVAAVLVETEGGNGVFTNNNATFGMAGIFQNINSANTSPALYAESGGNGASIWALKSTDAIAGDALLAQNWITSGSAGRFEITEAANTYPVLTVNNVGSGPAINTNHTANGIALSIQNGGMRVSTATLAGGGTISIRATAYIVDGNVYSFDGGISMSEGDIFYVYNNDTIDPATVEGVMIQPGSGRTFIFLANGLRAF